MSSWLRAWLLGRCWFCHLPLVLRRQGGAVWRECPAFRMDCWEPEPRAYRDSRLLTAAEMGEEEENR